MPATDPQDILPETAIVKSVRCGRFNQYEVNILNGTANWLLSRSNTVWAERFGYCRLMQSWAADLREILGGYAESHVAAELNPVPAERAVEERALELASEWLRTHRSMANGDTLATRCRRER